MSVYATFDESAGEQIASNLGWGDFVHWVGTLDDAPELAALVNGGSTTEIADALAELEQAEKTHRPTAKGLPETIAAIKELLATNKDQEILLITDGMSK